MKKFLSIFVALVAIVALTSCFDVNEVKSIEFTNAPAATYQKDEKVKADSFSVVISFTSGDPLTLKLNDSRLTVTGLNGTFLDTQTHGLKTINVSYQGFTVSVSYTVEGQFLSYWNEAILEADKTKTLVDFEAYGIASESQLAQFAKLVNETPALTAGKKYNLGTNKAYDLGAHEWVPIVGFKGTLDGDGATIKGLRITDGTSPLTSKGFFASTNGSVEVKNITFENAFINTVTDGLGETNKNLAAVIGKVDSVSGSETKITNVIVKDSTIVGHGRIGALVGQTNSKVVITNSQSLSNSFTAVNGFAAKSADGNGDKVAGLVGQAQSEIIISDSIVDGVTINGTRDLGGLIGFSSVATTLNNNEVRDSIIQASVPGGMLPTKGTRSIGVFVGTLSGSTAKPALTLGVGELKNDFEEVTLLANTLYQEITVTGVLFGGIRATANGVRKVVIGETTYEITSLVSPTESNILDYATEIEAITTFLLAVYNGSSPVLPTAHTKVGITLLP